MRGARQIENEYGNIDKAYGSAGKAYMRWAAGMAVSLDTGVPWVMCQQADAPDPLVRCDSSPARSLSSLNVPRLSCTTNGME